jgi:hypothetical protein
MLVQAAQNPFDGVWKVDLAESKPSTKIYAYYICCKTTHIVAPPVIPLSISGRMAETRRSSESRATTLSVSRW